MDIKEEKKEIRRIIRGLKNNTSHEERFASSIVIQKKILLMEELSAAKTILLYHALPDEVDTSLLLSTLSNRRGGVKKIILPVVEGEYLILKEYIPSEMVQGYRNISEPSSGEQINPAEIDFAVIPGVAFDSKCNRMGRGKGFYDRLLPFLKCPKIGIGYKFQIVDQVPCEKFDIPLDCVITETDTYKSPLNNR